MNDLQPKVLPLYYLHLFPPLAAVFLLVTSGITGKIVVFFLRLGFCVVVFIHKKENCHDLAVFFSPSVMPLSTML